MGASISPIKQHNPSSAPSEKVPATKKKDDAVPAEDGMAKSAQLGFTGATKSKSGNLLETA